MLSSVVAIVFVLRLSRNPDRYAPAKTLFEKRYDTLCLVCKNLIAEKEIKMLE